MRPAPLLRTSSRVWKPVARARLYASGLAYHDLRVNGRPASESVLDPGFTDYGKTPLDVTAPANATGRVFVPAPARSR